jgi:2-polyprenyl-3-methyl-5-hydroxy-6-metoxy-1,4-benzoquinol methylase
MHHDSDNAVSAALSGSQFKATGFAGGYLLAGGQEIGDQRSKSERAKKSREHYSSAHQGLIQFVFHCQDRGHDRCRHGSLQNCSLTRGSIQSQPAGQQQRQQWSHNQLQETRNPYQSHFIAGPLAYLRNLKAQNHKHERDGRVPKHCCCPVNEQRDLPMCVANYCGSHQAVKGGNRQEFPERLPGRKFPHRRNHDTQGVHSDSAKNEAHKGARKRRLAEGKLGCGQSVITAVNKHRDDRHAGEHLPAGAQKLAEQQRQASYDYGHRDCEKSQLGEFPPAHAHPLQRYEYQARTEYVESQPGCGFDIGTQRAPKNKAGGGTKEHGQQVVYENISDKNKFHTIGLPCVSGSRTCRTTARAQNAHHLALQGPTRIIPIPGGTLPGKDELLRIMLMEKITDWNALWRELVDIKSRSRKNRHGRDEDVDVWCKKAAEFKEGVKRRWSRPDSSRDFILSQMNPEATVLDIGAGTGAWAALMAGRVKRVTAVEPSVAMIEVMRESLSSEGITNVDIVRGSWPDVSVAKHDFSLCSHAVYGYPDLPAFVRQMVASTRRICFLLLRAPTLDGVRSEAARRIWGQPLDSPNFTIAYNILLHMGIYANVLMENTGLWEPRTSPSLDDALRSMKHFLGLSSASEHDEYLMDLLRRRLNLQKGLYVWPREVRSALVYWQAGE